MLMIGNSPKVFPIRSNIDSRGVGIFDIYDLEFTNLGWLALSPCHSVAYDMQTEMSSLPTGGLCLLDG